MRYGPEDALVTPRFAGVRTFMRLPHVRTTENVDFAVVGIPFDTGATFRVGARFGPSAIRNASVLLRPYNPAHRLAIFERLSGVDYGDLPVVPGNTEASYGLITEGLRPLVAAGVVPIALGGDHSITLAELRAVHAALGPVALVQFDSHPDTWDSYWGQRYTHGTPFLRACEEGLLDAARSAQVGLRGSGYGPDDHEAPRRLGFDVLTADDVRRLGLEVVVQRIRRRVGPGPAFVSFDVDFLDPVYAPGTGTPEVGGFSTADALVLLRGLAGLDIVAADVVEVLPALDPAEVTALAAATVAYELISLLALGPRRRKP